MWTLPPDDDDFSTRWRLIKTFFARALPNTERLSRVRRTDDERGIGQRHFWEHAIRDDADFAEHLDYVHFDPVKHGMVMSPADWPYSTFPAYVARSLYPVDWIGSVVETVHAGEPGGWMHASDYA